MKIRRDLSLREWRIHDLMEEGLPNDRIAAALGISTRTATIYVANLRLIEAAQDVLPADAALDRHEQAHRSGQHH